MTWPTYSRSRAPLAVLVFAVALLSVTVIVAACSPASAPAPTAGAKAAAPQPTAAPAAAAQPAAKAPGQPFIIRAGSSDPEGTTANALAVAFFAKRATELSEGEFKVEPAWTTLGVETQLIEQVISGSVDMGICATTNLARFSDTFLVLDLPFLFKGDKQHVDFLEKDPMGQSLVTKFEKETGTKALWLNSHTYGAEITGSDIMTRNKQVKVPADIKGMKIRVLASPVGQAVVRGWGANPTPIDWSQVYTSVQQGVVDGVAGPTMPAYYSIKLYEASKYYLQLTYANFTLPMLMNTKRLESLTPKQQKAILDAAAETTTYQHQEAKKAVDNATSAMKTAGVTFYKPTPEELALWMAPREAMWRDAAEGLKGKIDLNMAEQIRAKQGW